MPRLARRTVVPVPRPDTLAKYGLTAADWHAMLVRQNFTCPVCEGPIDGTRRLVVDHAHVAGFKARKRRKSRKKKVGTAKDGRRMKLSVKDVRRRVMTPEERATHVRGVLHAWCNGYVRKWLTLSRARSIVRYLEDHELRRVVRAETGR